jgi:hypothetical protein
MDAAQSSNLLKHSLMVSSILCSMLVLNFTENAGKLLRNGTVDVDVFGTNLSGLYATSLSGLSVITASLGFCFLFYWIYFRRKERIRGKRFQVFWIVVLLCLIVTSATLNIVLVNSYSKLMQNGSLQTDPSDMDMVVHHNNFKLRGSFGVGVVAMASLSVFGTCLEFGNMALNHHLDTTNPAAVKQTLMFSHETL